ncbi:hypothetical protein GCM10010404_93000 [Nonomuraea africana]
MTPEPFKVSSDSLMLMYGAARPPVFVAGYHSETMRSLAFEPGSQGSGREVSVRCSEVVPTGWEPVGFGSESATVRAVLGGSAGAFGEGLRDGRSTETLPVSGADTDAHEVVIAMTSKPVAKAI